MTTQVEVTKVGDKFVMDLTPEMIEKLNVKDGDKIVVTTLEGSVVLRSRQAEERTKLIDKYTAEIFEEHKEVLEALAEGAK